MRRTNEGAIPRAANLWAKLGCPYEAALALADGDDEGAMRVALQELHRLESRPAAAIVARRLRARSARAATPRTASRDAKEQMQLDAARA